MRPLIRGVLPAPDGRASGVMSRIWHRKLKEAYCRRRVIVAFADAASGIHVISRIEAGKAINQANHSRGEQSIWYSKSAYKRNIGDNKH